MKNHIDNGGQPEAAVNKGNELGHPCLIDRPLGGMGDTMVLVPSSRGKFSGRKIRKVVTQKRRKPAIYYGRVCKPPPKWVDDDLMDWTMQVTMRGTIC